MENKTTQITVYLNDETIYGMIDKSIENVQKFIDDENNAVLTCNSVRGGVINIPLTVLKQHVYELNDPYYGTRLI